MCVCVCVCVCVLTRHPAGWTVSEMDPYNKTLMSSGVGTDAKVMESRRKHTGALPQPRGVLK